MPIKKIAIALTLLASPAMADPIAPFSAEDPAYVQALSQFGKEVFATRYATRHLCKDYNIAYRQEYFFKAPPNLWTNERYDAFMAKVMTETKVVMDRQEQALGHIKFCQSYVQFVLKTHEKGNLPIEFK